MYTYYIYIHRERENSISRVTISARTKCSKVQCRRMGPALGKNELSKCILE